MSSPTDILDFWFETTPDMSKWFIHSREHDAYIRNRFGNALRDVETARDLTSWTRTPEGYLALVILLDQFTRQIHRDNPKAFQNDRLAQRLTALHLDAYYPHLNPFEKMFALMPLMHAENMEMQTKCLLLVEHEAAHGDPFWTGVMRHAKGHYTVIERFGRFPKRNAALGRSTTAEEQVYIDATPNTPY